jgi:hypothetical protein
MMHASGAALNVIGTASAVLPTAAVDDATAHASAQPAISAPPQHPSSLLALVSVTQSAAAAAVDAIAGRPAISVRAISETSSLFSKTSIPTMVTT